MDRVCDQSFILLDVECVALLSIRTNEHSLAALRRAALRIRRNMRCSDSVLLLESSCLCVVALTSIAFYDVQAVGRRLQALLIDLDMELQILYGASALATWQRIQDDSAAIVVHEEEATFLPLTGTIDIQQPVDIDHSLPYLAFLTNYPPLRLLHLFPYELACQHRCVPVGCERGMLTLATCKRQSTAALSLLRESIQRNIFLVRCEPAMIDDLLSYWRHYPLL